MYPISYFFILFKIPLIIQLEVIAAQVNDLTPNYVKIFTFSSLCIVISSLDKISNLNNSNVDVFLDNISLTEAVSIRFWADVDDDVLDIQKVAAHWNTRVGDPDYDPLYDVDNEGQGNGDIDIDILDIQLVASWWNRL